MLRVVTWKWIKQGFHRDRIEYTARHVNVMRSMVSRHLHMPHEFVCITDDPEGIDPGIRIIPLWDHGLMAMGGCYVRLKVFAPEMRYLIGPRFVSIDLDTVIADDITPVFSRPESFIIWGATNKHTPYCGSMFMMRAGARRQVWEKFDPKRSPEIAREKGHIVGSDQAWISACLWPGETMWSVEDGVYSFRLHIQRPEDRLNSKGRPCRGGGDGSLPEGARIVFFHGREDPSKPEVQERYPWVKEHWR